MHLGRLVINISYQSAGIPVIMREKVVSVRPALLLLLVTKWLVRLIAENANPPAILGRERSFFSAQ